jgi:glycosyltransferase involved in cell wall biosynthesis
MLSIIIPSFNEEKTIKGVISDIKQTMRKVKIKYEIIVVNDGSTDRTAAFASSSGARVISQPNRGYGATLKLGIKNAKYEWVLITDADGTYPAKEIPHMLRERGSYDLIVGSRTGKNVNIPALRKPGKWVLSKLANYLSGFDIPDLNSGMRLFRKNDTLKYFNILPSGFSFTTTQTLSYLCSGQLVKYIPIDYLARKGKSKIRPFRDGMNFVMLIIRTIMYFNPLKVFLPISIVTFLSGFSYLLYQSILYQNITDLPVLVILVSVQMAFLGFIADIMAKRLS